MLKLSENFTLNEMVYSVTAEANGIDNRPSVQVIENLRQLCINVLQPLRNWCGCPVKVTSGFRCALLNRKVGGVKTSMHIMGMAADIVIPQKSMIQVYNYIKDNLPYDQLLYEYSGKTRWLHISYRPDGKNRKQAIANYKA